MTRAELGEEEKKERWRRTRMGGDQGEGGGGRSSANDFLYCMPISQRGK